MINQNVRRLHIMNLPNGNAKGHELDVVEASNACGTSRPRIGEVYCEGRGTSKIIT